jgi:hypothetical protein
MTEAARIIVLGTSHPLQCGTTKQFGTEKYTEAQINEFELFLRQLCVERKIECIIEEMNVEGLENYEVENTIAYSICKDLNIKHHHADLTAEHIADLCLHIDMFMLREQSNEMKCRKRELLHNQLLNPIRERFWLANILSLNTWPTLFICGSDHVINMLELINSLVYGPVDSLVKY